MTHLTRGELIAWRDQPQPSPAARDTVVGHLAACDECAGVYAELMRTRVAEMPPERFEAHDFVARGYSAAARPQGRVLAFRPRLLIPLAAAAAILLAVLLPAMRQERDAIVETDAVRGSRPQAIAPAGGTSGPIEFRWASHVSAARYVVEVKDAAGQRVFYRETRDERLAADAALDAALRPGARYTWTVTALDEAGERISQSPPREFTRVAGPPQ